MKQFENNLLPKNFDNMFTRVNNTHNISTKAALKNLMSVPTVSTKTHGTLSINYQCIKSWNELKSKNLFANSDKTSLNEFKAKATNHFLQSY